MHQIQVRTSTTVLIFLFLEIPWSCTTLLPGKGSQAIYVQVDTCRRPQWHLLASLAGLAQRSTKSSQLVLTIHQFLEERATVRLKRIENSQDLELRRCYNFIPPSSPKPTSPPPKPNSLPATSTVSSSSVGCRYPYLLLVSLSFPIYGEYCSHIYLYMWFLVLSA